MSTERQPFTEFAKKAQPEPGKASSSSKPGWIVAAIIAAFFIAALVLWQKAEKQLLQVETVHAETTNKLVGVSAEAEQSKAALGALQSQITALQSQVATLEQEKEKATNAVKSLEDEMRAGLESKDVTISKLQGKLTVNILDRVMFDSAEAIMKPDGEAVLKKIATILQGHPELKIQVIGHTDNVPIRNRFASNWELSTARALAAVHYLTEKAGVDPQRVGAVGYGEYRPIADNATPEGRAKNRRIAVTILPDELAVADAVAIVAPHGTNDVTLHGTNDVSPHGTNDVKGLVPPNGGPDTPK